MKKKNLYETVREILHSPMKEKYTICFIDRRAPQKTRTIKGNEIDAITPVHLILLKDGTSIPVHRIIEIRYEKEVVIKRRGLKT